ncbi:MAG: PPC domain-containing protein [Roseofilum sp. SBFL]|nr:MULTISPECIES: PPC domain-containing protein [unclassified Roseofilum]MBP0013237.1 PPC domain-containing protein [Roseofilum sp. SID3]MBP0026121.1 PPC domain-containing protein [Roseofilum sp. SID2]MBP0038457.1 PPC domain-containing protein [Roseofilum sp. SID1]MBP0040902.1 PPC domain-containing protein [Roseofilum sp. SBFL]
MLNSLATPSSGIRFVFSLLMAIGLQTAAQAQSAIYNPKPLPTSNEITDTLSQKDIPTGQGGFARDYMVNLNEGDNVVVDLHSDQFDTIVTLLGDDGTTIAENDDGPDGSTNSLLFARITKSGTYIVRVRAFGETAGGQFNLKLTRLRPI